MSYISNHQTIREKTDYFYVVIIYIVDACQQFSSSSVMHNLNSNLTRYWPAVFQGYYHNQHCQKCFIVVPVTTHCSSQWALLSWKDIQERFHQLFEDFTGICNASIQVRNLKNGWRGQEFYPQFPNWRTTSIVLPQSHQKDEGSYVSLCCTSPDSEQSRF